MRGGRELKDSKGNIAFLDGSVVPLKGYGRQEKHLSENQWVGQFQNLFRLCLLCLLKSAPAFAAPTWLERR